MNMNEHMSLVFYFYYANLFSNNSFRAFAGLWMTSPAAIRLITVSSNFFILPGTLSISVQVHFTNYSLPLDVQSSSLLLPHVTDSDKQD